MKPAMFSIGVLVLLCHPRLTSAQSITALPDSSQIELWSESSRVDEQKLCFRAQGCPNCDTIVLLEFAMAEGPERCGQGPLISGEFGILQNVSRTYGVGGTVFYGVDDCGGRFGLRARVRRWLSPQIGLDLGPGIVLAGSSDDGNREFPAFSGQIALDLFGLIAPMYQLEMERTTAGTHWDSYIGLRAESYGAPLAFLVIGAIAAVSISGAGF